MPTTVIKSVGTGKDFATLSAFATYLTGRSLIGNDELLIAEVYEDQTISGKWFSPNNVDDTRYCIIRPAAGLGHIDLVTGALDYGTTGVQITVTSASFNVLGNGVVIEGFRINMVGTNAGDRAVFLLSKSGQTGAVSTYQSFRKNLIKVTGAAPVCALEIGNSNGIGHIHDNLVIMESNAPFIKCDTQITERNTFIRRNGSTGFVLGLIQAIGISRIHNNAFLNCGDTPTERVNGSLDAKYIGNYSNVAVAASQVGITAVTSSALVVNLASDLRPTTNSALIGNASTSADSTSDIRNSNRGPEPDVGALQLTPAPPSPTCTITSQILDGQTLTISGITTNTPTSGTATLSPAATPNGAIQQGPTAITLGSNTFTVVFSGIPAGDYLTPTITTANAGGASPPAPGGNAFSILGAGGGGDIPDAVVFTAPVDTYTASTGQALYFGKAAPVIP